MSEKFICNAAWNSITFYPNNKIAPCCSYEYTMAIDVGHLDGVNTFRELQQEMLTGKKPQGCKSCWGNEEKGLDSYRQNYGIDETERSRIRFLDIRNNNTCNLACRMCGPEFSSTWTKTIGKMEIKIQDIWSHLETLDLSSLYEIYFTGGEPMLNPDHWRLLEKLISEDRAKNIVLRYNTNLTLLTYKDKSVMDLWPNFLNVHIYGSLEGTGRVVEFYRSGSNWANINSTVDQLLEYKKQHKKINLNVFCSVGILNIWELQSLIDWCSDRDINLNLSKLFGPDILAIDTLPNDVKYLIDRLKIMLNPRDTFYQNNLRIIELCRLDAGKHQHLFVHTIAHTLMMDRTRKDDMFGILPQELQDYAKRKILLG